MKNDKVLNFTPRRATVSGRLCSICGRATIVNVGGYGFGACETHGIFWVIAMRRILTGQTMKETMANALALDGFRRVGDLGDLRCDMKWACLEWNGAAAMTAANNYFWPAVERVLALYPLTLEQVENWTRDEMEFAVTYHELLSKRPPLGWTKPIPEDVPF